MGQEVPGKISEAALLSAAHYLFPQGQAIALAAEGLACHKLLSLEQNFPKWLITGSVYSAEDVFRACPDTFIINKS